MAKFDQQMAPIYAFNFLRLSFQVSLELFAMQFSLHSPPPLHPLFIFFCITHSLSLLPFRFVATASAQQMAPAR